MIEFLKIFAYTILGVVAFCMMCMFGIFIIMMLWPLLIVAFPLAIIIYIVTILNKNNQNKKGVK